MKTAVLAVILALVLASPLAAGGIALIRHGVVVLHDPRVRCGEHVMKPGDTCTHSDDENGTHKDDYQGMKDSQTTDGYFFIVSGGLLIAIAVGFPVLVGFRGRRILARLG